MSVIVGGARYQSMKNIISVVLIEKLVLILTLSRNKVSNAIVIYPTIKVWTWCLWYKMWKSVYVPVGESITHWSSHFWWANILYHSELCMVPCCRPFDHFYITWTSWKYSHYWFAWFHLGAHLNFAELEYFVSWCLWNQKGTWDSLLWEDLLDL